MAIQAAVFAEKYKSLVSPNHKCNPDVKLF